jgi:cytochrome oxidase Cu insertion factor (SCO1/SenC/PrrC family)
MPRRSTMIFAAVILVIAAAFGGGLLLLRQTGGETGSGVALVGGPFSLTDQTGRRVTEKDFAGKYMLVFFGYTYCPDVCPTELQVMLAALDQMGEAGKDIVPVFVSIDPERDTPQTVKAYVENFGPRLVGLTGSPEEIAAVAQAYRVYYAKAGNKTGDDYLMDHSSIIYLMGPDGRFVKHFTYTTDAAKLSDNLKEALTGSS